MGNLKTLQNVYLLFHFPPIASNKHTSLVLSDHYTEIFFPGHKRTVQGRTDHGALGLMFLFAFNKVVDFLSSWRRKEQLRVHF